MKLKITKSKKKKETSVSFKVKELVAIGDILFPLKSLSTEKIEDLVKASEGINRKEETPDVNYKTTATQKIKQDIENVFNTRFPGNVLISTDISYIYHYICPVLTSEQTSLLLEIFNKYNRLFYVRALSDNLIEISFLDKI